MLSLLLQLTPVGRTLAELLLYLLMPGASTTVLGTGHVVTLLVPPA